MSAENIIPLNEMVFIRVEEVDEMHAGLLWKPEDALEREQLAHDIGTLVSAGEMAFCDWVGRKPEIGEMVVFDRYKGRLFRFRNADRSQTRYRLISSANVCAIIEGILEEDK